MKNKKIKSIKRSAAASALALAILATGCTRLIKNPDTGFTGYKQADRIDLKVRVNITDECRRPEWKRKVMGDTWLIRPGDWLAANSTNLARHVFQEVVEVHASKADAAGVDAVLTPKVTYVNRTMGATSFGESITSVKVEWHLNEQGAGRRQIWVETITGEGRGSTGWTSPRKPLKDALEELMAKSQEAMLSAQAIRSYAARLKERTSSQ